MKITAIECNFGYVEDASIATVVFQAQGHAFPSKEEAVRSLAENLKSIFMDENNSKPKLRKCCKGKTGKFCSECGSSLLAKEFDSEEFRYWLKEIVKHTNDSWGYPDDADWEPGSSFNQLCQMKESGFDILCFSQADQILTDALEDDYKRLERESA